MQNKKILTMGPLLCDLVVKTGITPDPENGIKGTEVLDGIIKNHGFVPDRWEFRRCLVR